LCFFFFFLVVVFCQADALPLEPCLQPYILWLFWRYSHSFRPSQPGPLSSYFRLPTIAEITDTHQTQPAFFCWDGILQIFSPRAGLEPKSSRSQPLASWNDRCSSIHAAIAWDTKEVLTKQALYLPLEPHLQSILLWLFWR
jgi:hypothetical protein